MKYQLWHPIPDVVLDIWVHLSLDFRFFICNMREVTVSALWSFCGCCMKMYRKCFKNGPSSPFLSSSSFPYSPSLPSLPSPPPSLVSPPLPTPLSSFAIMSAWGQIKLYPWKCYVGYKTLQILNYGITGRLSLRETWCPCVCMSSLVDLPSGGAWLLGRSDALRQGMWWAKRARLRMAYPAEGVGQPSGRGGQVEHLSDGLWNLQMKLRLLMFNFKWLNINV